MKEVLAAKAARVWHIPRVPEVLAKIEIPLGTPAPALLSPGPLPPSSPHYLGAPPPAPPPTSELPLGTPVSVNHVASRLGQVPALQPLPPPRRRAAWRGQRSKIRFWDLPPPRGNTSRRLVPKCPLLGDGPPPRGLPDSARQTEHSRGGGALSAQLCPTEVEGSPIHSATASKRLSVAACDRYTRDSGAAL